MGHDDLLGQRLARAVMQRSLAAVAGPPGRAILSRVLERPTWNKDAQTIWVKDTGTRFEEMALAGQAGGDAANIAGNFPIIDDFRGGVATSLKTIDIVSNYQGNSGIAQLTSRVNEYKSELGSFRGRTYAGHTIAMNDVKKLKLVIAYPPKPQAGAPGYDDRLDALKRAAEVDEEAADTFAINKENGRPRRERTQVEYAPRVGAPKKRILGAPENQAAGQKGRRHDAPQVTMEVELREVPNIWTNVPGRRYELDAFAGDAEGAAANIGGNFPTIDDFRGGVATSLKTINIVERFNSKRGADDVKRTIDGYIADLATFKGQSWPAGANYHGPPALLSSDGKRVVVKHEDVVSLRLKIAMPPVTAILAAKRAELAQPMISDADEARLEKEIAAIDAKRNVVLAYHNKPAQTANGKAIAIVVEERI